MSGAALASLCLGLAGLAGVARASEVSAFTVHNPCPALAALDGLVFRIAGRRAHPGVRQRQRAGATEGAEEDEKPEEGSAGEHADKMAPYFKAERSDFYVHYGHACNAQGRVEYGWLIDEELPSNRTIAALQGEIVSLHEHEACRHLGQIQWFQHEGPPFGTTRWRMFCGAEFEDVALTLQIEERSEETVDECVPSVGTGVQLGGRADGAADARLINVKSAWLKVKNESDHRLVSGVLLPRNESEFPHTQTSMRWLIAAFDDAGLNLVELEVHVRGRHTYARSVSAKYVPGHTAWQTEEPGTEANGLFTNPAAVDVAVGCPGVVEVDSLTFAMLYRRMPHLMDKPRTTLRVWILAFPAALLLAVVAFKVTRCMEIVGNKENKKHNEEAPKEATLP